MGKKSWKTAWRRLWTAPKARLHCRSGWVFINHQAKRKKESPAISNAKRVLGLLRDRIMASETSARYGETRVLFPFLLLLESLLNNQIVVYILLQGKISQLLLNVWACVVWENQIDYWRSCIEGTCKAFLQCEYEGVFLKALLDWMSFRTPYSDVSPPQSG